MTTTQTGGLLTAEQVLPGHPDKVADQISDALLDAHLAGDPTARVAIETMVTADTVIISGEVTSRTEVDYEHVTRETIRRIGYTAENGYAPDKVNIQLHLTKQSPEIASGVNWGGAGDQGIVFGYATNETDTLMPAPHALATDLAKRLHRLTQTNPARFGPDGKTQATIEYDEDGKPARVAAIVVAIQHAPDMPQKTVHTAIREYVIKPALDNSGLRTEGIDVHINSAGPWTHGGPAADTGLTGRKLIADTYGGSARHGGGAFSGKDPSKVDRSGAYAARQAARWVVDSGLADRAEVQLAYTIGQENPVSVRVDTHGTGHGLSDRTLDRLVANTWDMRPEAIIDRLYLRAPHHKDAATFGHFGNPDYPWEQVTRRP